MEDVACFVGIDAHATRCSIKAVSRDGADLVAEEVPTRREDLIAPLKGLPRPVWLVVEASTMAPFVRDCIEPAVDRVIVCETRENRWIAKSEDKSDLADADRLARLLRMGECKEVHLPRHDRQELRELMILARKAVVDVTRAKNRINSKYRQHGIAVKGTGVYTASGRGKWLAQINSPELRFMLDVLYEKLDGAQATEQKVHKRLLVKVKRTGAYRRLLMVPGFGPTVCAVFIAVIDDPWRFPGKRKLWQYAGLGVRRRSSGPAGHVAQGGSRSGNRLLKYVAMLAAHAAVRKDNKFTRHHQEMLSGGVEPSMAIRTTARNILATALAIWKSGDTYRDAA
jgi:transposase